MDEFFVRATLVKERVDKLANEGRRVAFSDPERAEAINAEMDVLVQSLETIREEQLISMLPKPKLVKKRWWKRGQ